MWDGHLNAVTALLNLFAATCHIHYAKSARLYVQEMRKLPSTHPWLHQKFVEGYHTVRRSERLWAALWTDIVIEQVLMRYLKSRGGLTRGRGMTESVRQQWVYSMHACAAIRDAMTSLTGKHHTPSHQHCRVRRSKASAWPARHEHISRLVPFTWSIWWQCPTASFTTKSWQCICQKCNHKEASDGAHSEWVEIGGQGAKVDKQLYRSTIRSCSCVVSSRTTRKWGHHSLLCLWDDGSSYFSLQILLHEESRQVWTWQGNQEECEEYYTRLCNPVSSR